MHSWHSQDLWLPFLLSAISRKGVPSLPLSPPPVVKDSPQDPGCCCREPGLSHTTGIAGYSLPTLLPPRERVPPLGTSAWCSASLGAGDTRKASLTTPSAVTKLCLVCYVLFLLFLEWCAGRLDFCKFCLVHEYLPRSARSSRFCFFLFSNHSKSGIWAGSLAAPGFRHLY